jgi:hypothetical protein
MYLRYRDVISKANARRPITPAANRTYFEPRLHTPSQGSGGGTAS